MEYVDVELNAEGQIVVVGQDIILGDPYTYWDGTTAERLRSGVDGPHAGLADRLCNINGRFFE